MRLCSCGHDAVLLPSTQINRRRLERSGPVEMPLPSTAEGFLAVPTDISGVLNTSPTESQGVCPHYVKRGLRAHVLGERLPGDLSIYQSTQKEARKQEDRWRREREMSGFLPALRRAISTWTLCGGRLAPRRANEGYTAEPAALARLVCQAYHRRPGRTRLSPPRPRLAHSRCQQSRAAPPQGRRVCCGPTPAVMRQDEITRAPMGLAPAYF